MNTWGFIYQPHAHIFLYASLFEVLAHTDSVLRVRGGSSGQFVLPTTIFIDLFLGLLAVGTFQREIGVSISISQATMS